MTAPASQLDRSTAIYLELRSRLAALYDLQNDDEALLDSLEGATDLYEQIGVTLREAKTFEAMAQGIDDLIDQMKARKTRLETKADKMRAIVVQAMQDAELRTVTLPDMTITRMPGRSKTVIVDPSMLPHNLRFAETVYHPNKDAIKELVDQGDVPSGVEVRPPQPFLTIRTR